MSLEEVDVGDFADDDSQLKNTFQQKVHPTSSTRDKEVHTDIFALDWLW